MSTSVAIDIRKVKKVYRTRTGTVEALSEVDLGISPGEFIAVLGPSGCGKSTLMMIAAGLVPASAGAVLINGQAVRSPYTNCGIVFQRDLLLEWRTVLQNVLLPIELKGMPSGRYVDRAHELLAQVGLEGFAEQYPQELSGGMRQRVALVRALIHDPPLLLMDEPFGALDALTREQMNLDLLRLCSAGNHTVLFITHSIEEAVLLSTRILVMSPRPGRVLEVIDNDLPTPRGTHSRRDPVFQQHVDRIRTLFHSAGILSE